VSFPKRREGWRAELPELLAAQAPDRYAGLALGLSNYDAGGSPMSAAMAEYFEEPPWRLVGPTPREMANWVTGDIAAISMPARVVDHRIALKGLRSWRTLCSCIDERTISGKIAKDLLRSLLEQGWFPQRSWPDRESGHDQRPSAITADRGGAAGGPIQPSGRRSGG